jgi:hypothetical protein
MSNCTHKQLQRRPIPRRAIEGTKAECKKNCNSQNFTISVPYLPAIRRAVHNDEDGDEGDHLS